MDAIGHLTAGMGVNRAIDAVGVDATCPHAGPAAEQAKRCSAPFQQEVKEVAPETSPHSDNGHRRDAPSQVLSWAVQGLAKAGTLSIIGV